MGLLSLHPGIWLAALALLAGSFGAGWIKGAASERAEIAMERVRVIVKRDKDIRTINAKDGELVAAFETGRASRAAEVEEIKNGLEKLLQQIGDGAQCALPGDAVRLLNRARGATLAAPAADADAAVPRPRGDPGRSALDPGAADGQGRGAIRDVRGPAQKDSGRGEAAATTRLTLQGLTP